MKRNDHTFFNNRDLENFTLRWYFHVQSIAADIRTKKSWNIHNQVKDALEDLLQTELTCTTNHGREKSEKYLLDYRKTVIRHIN